MNKIFLFLFSFLALISCNKSKDDSPLSCTFSEEHHDNYLTATFTTGKKVAQRFFPIRSANFTSITIEMDLLTTTSVTLKVYAGGGANPESLGLLAQSTLSAPYAENTGKVKFNFSPFALDTNLSYFMVIEYTGGNIDLTESRQSDFPTRGEIWWTNAGSWSQNTLFDISFSLAGDC